MELHSIKQKGSKSEVIGGCSLNGQMGGMIWKNGIKTCMISYKKLIASAGLMQDTGCLGLVHWDNPERWYREGGVREAHIGNSCTPMADSY